MMGMISGNPMWELLKTYATRLSNLFRNSALPDTVEMDLDGFLALNSIDGMFLASSGGKTFRIKNYKSSLTNISIADFVYYNTSVTRIEFIDCDFAPQNWYEFCRTAMNLETIVGELDFTNATNVNQIFASAVKLQEVRFKQNSLKISMAKINDSPLLSDASIISIANGLNGSVTGQSISLHATPKARCATLMGNNIGGVFIADEQGAMSLETFVTTIKGWTLT